MLPILSHDSHYVWLPCIPQVALSASQVGLRLQKESLSDIWSWENCPLFPFLFCLRKLRTVCALRERFYASDSPLPFLSKCILSLQEETHGGPLRKNLWLSSSRQTQGGKIWSDSFTCWFWSVPFQIHLICKTNSAPNMSYTVICTAVTSWLQSNSLLFSESPPPPWKDCFAGVAGADISSSMTDLRSEERGTPPGMASATSTPRRCVRVQQKYKQGIRRFQQVKFKTKKKKKNPPWINFKTEKL